MQDTDQLGFEIILLTSSIKSWLIDFEKELEEN